ncbi:UNVERIFIED_CONTAM: hypothetical protein HDU68_012035 [Siphonaria sp. JEL0065]|nr:hypothetical protein HDU68_012035 [Siphonaria sp. JEL0065]
MERSTRRGWASNQVLNASTSSLHELVNPTAPAVRWERSWTASVKAQFYKWNIAPDKEPVDFSEDDLYITDVPDGDEQDEEMDAERDEEAEEGGPKITVEEDNDAMDTTDDTTALKDVLSASFGGDGGNSSRTGILILKTVVHSAGTSNKYHAILIRANTVESIASASSTIMDAYNALYMKADDKSDETQRNSKPLKRRTSIFASSSSSLDKRNSIRRGEAKGLVMSAEYTQLLEGRRVMREVEAYGQLAYAATSGHAVLVFIPTVSHPFHREPLDPDHIEEPWYLQMDKVARIFDETEINVACQLSFLTTHRQEYKFLCESSSSYRCWIDALDDCWDECHPFEGLSKHYDLKGKRASYVDSESSTYSSLPQSPASLDSRSRSRGSSSNPSKLSSNPSKLSGKATSLESKKKKERKSQLADGYSAHTGMARSYSSPSVSLHANTVQSDKKHTVLPQPTNDSNIRAFLTEGRSKSVCSTFAPEKQPTPSKATAVAYSSTSAPNSASKSFGSSSFSFFFDSLKRASSTKSKRSSKSSSSAETKPMKIHVNVTRDILLPSKPAENIRSDPIQNYNLKPAIRKRTSDLTLNTACIPDSLLQRNSLSAGFQQNSHKESPDLPEKVHPALETLETSVLAVFSNYGDVSSNVATKPKVTPTPVPAVITPSLELKQSNDSHKFAIVSAAASDTLTPQPKPQVKSAIATTKSIANSPSLKKDYASAFAPPPRIKGIKRSSSYVTLLRETTEQILSGSGNIKMERRATIAAEAATKIALDASKLLQPAKESIDQLPVSTQDVTLGTVSMKTEVNLDVESRTKVVETLSAVSFQVETSKTENPETLKTVVLPELTSPPPPPCFLQPETTEEVPPSLRSTTSQPPFLTHPEAMKIVEQSLLLTTLEPLETLATSEETSQSLRVRILEEFHIEKATEEVSQCGQPPPPPGPPPHLQTENRLVEKLPSLTQLPPPPPPGPPPHLKPVPPKIKRELSEYVELFIGTQAAVQSVFLERSNDERILEATTPWQSPIQRSAQEGDSSISSDPDTVLPADEIMNGSATVNVVYPDTTLMNPLAASILLDQRLKSEPDSILEHVEHLSEPVAFLSPVSVVSQVEYLVGEAPHVTKQIRNVQSTDELVEKVLGSQSSPTAKDSVILETPPLPNALDKLPEIESVCQTPPKRIYKKRSTSLLLQRPI